MLFIGQVIMKGRGHALRGVIGNAIGMLIVAIIISFGLGPLILKSSFALSAIRMLGAIALLFIGIGYLVASKAASPVFSRTAIKEEITARCGSDSRYNQSQGFHYVRNHRSRAFSVTVLRAHECPYHLLDDTYRVGYCDQLPCGLQLPIV